MEWENTSYVWFHGQLWLPSSLPQVTKGIKLVTNSRGRQTVVYAAVCCRSAWNRDPWIPMHPKCMMSYTTKVPFHNKIFFFAMLPLQVHELIKKNVKFTNYTRSFRRAPRGNIRRALRSGTWNIMSFLKDRWLPVKCGKLRGLKANRVKLPRSLGWSIISSEDFI